jgi:uncharacterized tellurite resistance protein B-like protein
MALIDRLKADKNHELTEAEATFCIFMSVIYADGKMSDGEIDEFSYYFRKIKLFKSLSISELFPEFQKLFKKFGYNAEKVVEMACPIIAANNRLPVFIYCCDFVYSDGLNKSNEERILQKITDAFSLDEKLAESAINLMKRKSQL